MNVNMASHTGRQQESGNSNQFNDTEIQYVYIPQGLETLPGKDFLLALCTRGTPNVTQNYCIVLKSSLDPDSSNVSSGAHSLKELIRMYYTKYPEESPKNSTPGSGGSELNPQFIISPEIISEGDSLETDLSGGASEIVDQVPEFDSNDFLKFLEEIYPVCQSDKLPLDTNLANKVRKTVAELLKYLTKSFRSAPPEEYRFYLRCYKDLSNVITKHELSYKKSDPNKSS